MLELFETQHDRTVYWVTRTNVEDRISDLGDIVFVLSQREPCAEWQDRGIWNIMGSDNTKMLIDIIREGRRNLDEDSCYYVSHDYSDIGLDEDVNQVEVDGEPYYIHHDDEPRVFNGYQTLGNIVTFVKNDKERYIQICHCR